MNEKKLEIQKKESLIIIPLIEVVAQERKKNEKGEVEVIDSMTPDGERMFTRNDLIGLQRILAKFDTKLYDRRDWKLWTQIKEELYKCYIHNKKELELRFEQATFLKKFLDEFPEKEGKQNSLTEFEVRTMLGILEVLH